MEAPRDIWFYAKGGEKYGPFTFADLRALALQGYLDPRTDLVWQADMPQWISAGKIPELYSQPDSPPLPKATPRTELLDVQKEEVLPVSPAETIEPVTQAGLKPVAAHPEIESRGSSRIDFFFGLLILPLILWGICFFVLGFFGDKIGPEAQFKLRWFVAVFPTMVVFLAMIRRLQNLEMNPLWIFGLFIPGLNLWLLYRCLCAPEAYALHQWMDIPGKLGRFAYWSLVLLAILIVSAAFLLFGLKGSDLGSARDFSIWAKETKGKLMPPPVTPEKSN